MRTEDELQQELAHINKILDLHYDKIKENHKEIMQKYAVFKQEMERMSEDERKVFEKGRGFSKKIINKIYNNAFNTGMMYGRLNALAWVLKETDDLYWTRNK